MAFDFIGLLVPIGVCVVLPIMVVWLTMRAKQNETNRKTEVMLKALENGSPIDEEFFKTQQSKPKTLKEKLLGRLTGALVTGFLGIAGLAGGIILCNKTGWDFESGPSVMLPIFGGILLSIGIALFVVFCVGRKMLSKEIEAEEKNLTEVK